MDNVLKAADGSRDSPTQSEAKDNSSDPCFEKRTNESKPGTSDESSNTEAADNKKNLSLEDNKSITKEEISSSTNSSSIPAIPSLSVTSGRGYHHGQEKLSSTIHTSASSALPSLSSDPLLMFRTGTLLSSNSLNAGSPSVSYNTIPTGSFSPSKTVVPLEMMPTIPLVPVQVPFERGGVVTVPTKNRGRPRGSISQFVPVRSGSPIGLTIRRGVKVKRLVSGLVRGGRRLVHSVSLDDKGVLGLKDDSTFGLDDDIHYSQDDMFVTPQIQEKWPGKSCAFCCLPEFSQLGQGEIIRYEPTPGFNLPEKDHFTEDVLREASVAKKFKSCLGSFKDKVKSPKKCLGDSPMEVVDELSLVGHTERPSLALLFTTIGQCFAHYMCALWSHGVELTSDDSVACVDKAVVTASETKCSFCKKLGASIRCRVDDCGSCYHFTCAMAVGALMDQKSVAMVCPSHVKKAKEHLMDMSCIVCEQNYSENSLLFCCSCGNHYHGMCLKPALSISPAVRAGWQCPDCKNCQACRHPADKDDIVCVVCDKAYHSSCARPQGLTHSRNDWKCKACRACGDCGSKTPGNGLSSRWHSNFTVCDSCYQLRNKGLACPVCKKAYRVIMQKSMAQCSLCKKYVHSQCDHDADLSIIQTKWNSDKSYEYTCSVCRLNPTARMRKESGSLSSRSPDRDDSQGESIPSEDSNDTEMGLSLEEPVSTLLKSPFTPGGILSLSSSMSPNTSISSSSSIPTSLSSFSNIQTGSYFDKPLEKSSNVGGSSYLMKGNTAGISRRGVLFPRMRGAVSSKFNFGKKGGSLTSGRKRGGATSVPTGRKGRGNLGMQGSKGYRGYFNYQPVTLQVPDSTQTSNKEEGEENKIIIIDASDKFSLWQDICAMCGSFGQDQEGRLIACVQCGQCFHPYCANVKVNRVVLEKGWRCLDCTVCEGCGERNDEARLVLCEDCDISCHIYCMTPPLDQVPAGIWKCKWCAVCQYCGATDPGKDSLWQQNYSMCGPCYSMTTCPVCDEAYTDAELIIQCSSCNRWLHASDDMIHTEDEAERCIEKGYLCLMCRSPDSLPPHLMPPSPPPKVIPKGTLANPVSGTQATSSGLANLSSSSVGAESPSRSMSPEDFMSKVFSNAQHWVDGTCLSDLGYHQIQNITLPPMKKPRNIRGFRSRPSLDSTGSRDMDEDDEEDDEKMDASTPQHWVYGMKEGTLLNARDHGDPPNLPEGFYTLPGPEQGTFILRKRRYRNIKTVGIGGFQVRARARKDEEKAREEAEMDPQALELRRRRSKWRTKKKIKLLEKFPSYIQEAFFGRNLMDTSNLEEDKKQIETLEEDAKLSENPMAARKIGSSIRLSQDELELINAAKERHDLAKQKSFEPVTAVGSQPLPDVRTFSMRPITAGPLPMNSPKEGQGFQTGPLPSQEGPIGLHATSTPLASRTDEKKLKEEKVDDLVEDDENNDAIEALFGAGGSALISDDLVRDIMNEEMKAEDTSFTEPEDRDHIDGESNVDGSKLTDLLGPGFNLEDVDDIMKNLRDESTDDSTPVSDSSSVGQAPTAAIRTAPSSSIVSPAVGVTLQQPVASNPSFVPSSAPSRPVSFVENPQRPPQSMMASQVVGPLNLPIQNQAKDAQGRSMTIKISSISLPQSDIPNPVITYRRHSSTVRPSFLNEVASQPHIIRGGPDFAAQNRVQTVSNVNPLHIPDNVPKSVGPNTLQNFMLAPGDNQNAQNIPVSHSNLPPQRMAVQSVRTQMPVPNQPGLNSPTMAIAQPNVAISNMNISRPQTSQFSSPSPNHQHQYSHIPVGHPSPRPPSVVSAPEIQKTFSTASENQSLSLTLEEDEALGPKATKAAVLYANIHNPTLRRDVALIQDRERQIKRMWKNLDAEQRKIYAQKARENKKEYFKNKQEYQRALKSKEKEGASSSGVSLTSQNPTAPSSNIIQGASSNVTLQRYQPDLSIMQSRNPLPQTSSHLGSTPAAVSIQHPVRSFPPVSQERMQFQQNVNEMISSSGSQTTAPNPRVLVSFQATGAPLPETDSPMSFRTSEVSQLNQSVNNERFGQANTVPGPIMSPATPRPLVQSNEQRLHTIPMRSNPQGGQMNQVQQQHSLPQQPMSHLNQKEAMATPGLPHGQFRQPLPPFGNNQQVRMRAPGQPTLVGQPQQHLDPRLRMVIQQQRVQREHHLQQQVIRSQPSPNPVQPASPQAVTAMGRFSPLFQQQTQGPSQPILSQNTEQHQSVPTSLSMSAAQRNDNTRTPLQQSPQLLPISETSVIQSEGHESELPEAVTRELEQLEKEQETKQQGNLELGNSAEFSQMEEDLLSGIGDFRDLLEYAVSDRERVAPTESSKLPANFFDNLEDSKNTEKQKEKRMDQNTSGSVPTVAGLSSAITARQSPTIASHGLSSQSSSGNPITKVPSPSVNPSGVPSQMLANQCGPSPTVQAQASPVYSNSPGSLSNHDHSPSQGNISPLTRVPVSRGVAMGIPSSPTIGGMGMANNSMIGPQLSPHLQQIQGPIRPMSQVSSHLQQQASLQEVYNSAPMGPRMVCQPGTSLPSHLIRPLQSPGPGSAPPPPPYPGHPPAYPRSQDQRLLIEDIIEDEKREQLKHHKGVVVQQRQLPPVNAEGVMPSGGHGPRAPFHRMPGQLNVGQGFSGNRQPGPMNSPRPSVDPGLHPALLQAGTRPSPVIAHQAPISIKTLPPLPLPPDNPQTESDFQMQQQYENWLSQQSNLIQSQQKYFETEINKLRRQKKSLNGRQRTLKKTGQELNEIDALELERVQREASTIQKQLDSCRKATRQHTMLINEYNTKKRQRQAQMMQSPSPTGVSPQPMISGHTGQAGSSPMHSTPHSPLMSHSPSSQHSLGMSPMVPSPHTPVASPNPTIIPQHSPHSMVVHAPHPSPGGDHSGSFSPQARMPSPSGSSTYCGSPQGGQPMMGHQGMRVRMPVLSPSGVGNQSPQMSPHMMVIRQNYPPGATFNQQQNQPMTLRHQYTQNMMPIRRPSCSGPVLSPGSNTGCLSPSGPVPSPVSNMSVRHSPVHSGLRSPISLPSPQMLSQYDNPGTPLTPRSNEMMAPYNDPGSIGYQVSSPHPSKLTSTPPSPYVNSGAVVSNAGSTVSEGSGNSSGASTDGYLFDYNLVNKKNPNSSELQFCQAFSKGHVGGILAGGSNIGASIVSGSSNIADNRDSNNKGTFGGGGNINAPIPITFPPLNFRRNPFGLKGGSHLFTRWGHFKLGLRGGHPRPMLEETPVNVTTTISVSTVDTITSTTTSHPSNVAVMSTISTNIGADNALLIGSQSKIEANIGLSSILSDSIKNPVFLSTNTVTSLAQPTYVSAVASAPTSVPFAMSKVIVPEPPKSDIPPSSRHQAVIGIPGGGSTISQSSLYSTNVDVGPGVRVPLVASSHSYNIPSSYPGTTSLGLINSSSTLIQPSIFSSSSNSKISEGTGTYALSSSTLPEFVLPINKQTLSLASDVNTLVSVANVSSQVNKNLPLNIVNPGIEVISNVAKVSHNTTGPLTFVTSGLREKTVGSSLVTTSMISSTIPNTQALLSHLGTKEVSSTPLSTYTTTSNMIPAVSGPISLPHSQSNLNANSTASSQSQSNNVPSTLSAVSAAVQSRSTMSHTLHHFPQQKLPVFLTAGNQSIPSSLQVITQQGQIITSNLQGHSPRVLSAALQQQRQPINIQNQNVSSLPGGQQKVQLPSLSQINSGQLTKTHAVQSLSQYGHVVQTTPSGQLIVQQQHQPTGVVFSNNGNQVRMMGQQVMMQQGVLRGGGVVVKSSSPVQGGVRMMMIHNTGQNITTPPMTRQMTPMMPPPVAKSPALHSASPIPRVSPAPSPVANSPSPHSPQFQSQSPHTNSPTHVPQHVSVSTPPIAGIQMLTTRKEGEDLKTKDSEASAGSLTFATVRSSKPDNSDEGNLKDVQIPSAPNALLKQLLQNAACANNTGQSAQLVLLRSTPTGFATHLSQVATQIPNPSNVTITKSLQDAAASHMNISNPILTQSRVSHIPRTGIITQQTDALEKSSQNISAVQVVTQAMSGAHLPKSIVINPNTSVNTVYTNQIVQGQNLRPLSTQFIRQEANGQTKIIQSIPGHQSTIVRSNLHVQNQATPNLLNHCRAQNSLSASCESASLSQVIQGSQTTSPMLIRSPSLGDGTENTSSKTEMHIIIPESLSGEQTPEMSTPNDSCDDPDEAKRARKKTPNQNRRKSQTKDNSKVQPAKRVRQSSRVEEDYDAYIEGMMSQLRAMPPLTVSEPFVPKNFNVCPIYGSGDLSKLGKKDYNHITGLLEGNEGSLTVKNMNDYYNTQPFGPIQPMVAPATKGPTQRGFYNQEFTPPKIGLPIDGDYCSEVEAACLNKPNILCYRESDSPDTVLSSSSPECVMPESPPPFRGLHLVDMDDETSEDIRKRSISPAVPLLIPVPVRTFLEKSEGDIKDIELDKENMPYDYSIISLKNKIGLTPALPLKDMGNVTVSLTLSSHGAQDVSMVLRSLANLLNIPPPISYDITDQSFDSGAKVRQMFKHVMNGTGKEQSVDMQSALNGMVKFCKQCNSLTQNLICKKLIEMPFLPKTGWEGIDDLSFCSNNCYIQFALAHKPVLDDKLSIAKLMSLDPVGKSWESGGFSLPFDKKKSSSSLTDDNLSDDSFKEVLKVPQYDDDKRGEKHKLEEEAYPKQADGKRFKGHQYKYWSKDSHVLPNKYEKPTNKEMTDLLFGMQITYRKTRLPEDGRKCSFCPLYGDAVADGSSRLLNYDLDKWIHLNCALWAEDVYETMSGSLMSLELALKKSMSIICPHCEQPGASIKCFKVRCSKMYHLNCAVKEGCTFYKNKTVYCQEHINKGDKENELSTLAVFRRVYIERDENRQIASVMHHTEMNHLLRIGSLVLMNIGQLLPHQLQAFHSPHCIYPIGYHVIRIYWSMRQLHKRCAYECFINDSDGEPEFKIVVREDGYEETTLASRSAKGVWNKILEPIVQMRQAKNVVKLFSQYISGEDLFGLTEPAIVRILESMPGIDSLSDYTFKYGSNPLFELPLAVNPTGCARAEPFTKSQMKRHHGIRTSAGSVKTGTNLRTAATLASFTMNFDPFTKSGHTRFIHYKKMKNEWRSSVYLARSKIQGLGLYAARDIEKNTPIIEYIGEIIRSELAEVREKRYEAQNRGIYMFRLDANRVVDATPTGGLARYVNHSCGPNCFTETVEIERDFKIIIASNRKIFRGEELSYDYKFDEEEDHKIPCLCGAENCRKWMN